MSENQLNGFLGVTMDKIKEMVDVNTVIGGSHPHPGRHHRHPHLPGKLRLRLGGDGPAL